MTTLTRRQLYDLVWSTPLRKLAEGFGISDVGLSKICDRHRVPTPPRGYWAKKEAGQKVKQSIFVQVDDPLIDTIDIKGRAQLPEPVRVVLDRQRAVQKSVPVKQRVPAPSPKTPINAADLHPGIKDAALSLRAKGEVAGKGNHWDNLRIAPDSRERVITFLDQLAHSCEKRGVALTVANNRFCAAVGPDDVHFIIQEKVKQVPHVQTKEEIAQQERWRKQQEHRNRGSSWDDFDAFPAPIPQLDIVWTGQVGVQVYGYGSGLRQTWNDGKTQTIESMLPDIVDGLEAHIAAQKVSNDKTRKREAEHAELKRRHALVKARFDREKSREQLLKKLIRTEQKIVELRTWLANQEKVSAKERPHTGRMVLWVQEQLKKLENFVEPNALELRIQNDNIFPGIDDLHDPLGDPPPMPALWY